MLKTMVSQNRLIHHFGRGLLYSVRSPSQTWPVVSVLSAVSEALRFREVHHSSQAEATMFSTTKTMM